MTLKVIGAGFGRTGTASLKIALETMLGGSCYHMSEVLGRPGHVDAWLEVASGKPDWDAIFGNYVATVDFPASSYWKELAEAYPDAKILLSIRDAQRWVQSAQETIFSKQLETLYGGTKWGRMVEATINDRLGCDLNNREALIAAFDKHNTAVRNAFGSERLLEYEVKEGWAPLCDFLGCEQPAAEFPRVNSRKEFAGVFELLTSPIGAKVMNGEGIDQRRLHEEMFKKD